MIEVQAKCGTALGPVRHQGKRPTCLAFTASDLNAVANATGHLSVEFLCHHAARRMQTWSANDGFTVEAILAATHAPGQPPECLYPYSGDNLDAPLTIPAPGLAPLYSSSAGRRGMTPEEVLHEVGNGHAVGIVVAVTRSLFRPETGIVQYDPMVLPDQYHAMVAVALGQHRTTAEPHLLLRNSWGPTWGLNGHAWISKSYLNMHLVEGMVF